MIQQHHYKNVKFHKGNRFRKTKCVCVCIHIHIQPHTHIHEDLRFVMYVISNKV